MFIIKGWDMRSVAQDVHFKDTSRLLHDIVTTIIVLL